MHGGGTAAAWLGSGVLGARLSLPALAGQEDPCGVGLPGMPSPLGLLYKRGFCPALISRQGGAGAGTPSLREAAEALDGALGAPVVPAGACGEGCAPQTITLFILAALSGELIDLVALPAFVLCMELSRCQREPVPGWLQPPRLWSPSEMNSSAQAGLENRDSGALRERLGRAGMGFLRRRWAGSLPPLQLSFLPLGSHGLPLGHSAECGC